MIETKDSEVLSSQPEILVAEGLRKSYGPRRALQGLTFSLKAGRIMGFLGPNGAGKTTSIRILTTMMEPEAGHFAIDGMGSECPEQSPRRLLEDVGLQQRGKSLIGRYSHGMRQRIGIARALVNDPVVVFLDEPTLGLDPRGQQELLELVQRIAPGGNPGVVLCSHLLSEIEGVCDYVVILN